MKKKDYIIIKHLRDNARKSITDISKETQIPVSTIFKKLKDLDKSVVKKYVAVLNYELTGHHQWNVLFLKIPSNQKKEFEEFLSNHPNINNLYEIISDFNYKLETVFKNIKEYTDFVELIKEKFEVSDFKDFNIIKDVKREGFNIN